VKRRPVPDRRRDRIRGAPATGVTLVLLGLVAAFAASCGSAAPPPAEPVVQQFSSPATIHHPPTVPPEAAVTGRLRAPGGPYLRDASGRIVFFHGVDAVYKRAPFVLYPAAHKPFTFSAADAAAIARLGFNVVRLGLEWQGLEPGHGGPNQPGVCTPGQPGNPHMYNAATVRAYLAKVAATVDLLGRYHVYTILDMHQDVWNQAFRGEGAPSWAVCTSGQRVKALPGRWSRNYRNGALDRAVDHFWDNDVVGNLQGQYDAVWGAVARYFHTNPWILGYDPYNEPFAPELTVSDRLHFASALECFYTGRHHPGFLSDVTDRAVCPPTDPGKGVVPTIQKADPGALVFVEPDLFSRHNQPSLLGPMNYPNLVFNFHSYCTYRSPVTGDPTAVDPCATEALTTLLRRESERPYLASRIQPGGPAWFMSEFGATHSLDLLRHMTGAADALQLGWSYWSWKYYGDPTGSSHEALAQGDGHLFPTAEILSRTYPQAVAGTPVTMSFEPLTGSFHLVYLASHGVHAPTVVWVARQHYRRRGYCTQVDGGHIVSPPGSSQLLVANNRSAHEVDVSVVAGGCRGRAALAARRSIG